MRQIRYANWVVAGLRDDLTKAGLSLDNTEVAEKVINIVALYTMTMVTTTDAAFNNLYHKFAKRVNAVK